MSEIKITPCNEKPPVSITPSNAGKPVSFGDSSALGGGSKGRPMPESTNSGGKKY